MKREKAKESLLQIYGFALKNQMHLTFELEAKWIFYICFTNFEFFYLHLLKDHSGAHQELQVHFLKIF